MAANKFTLFGYIKMNTTGMQAGMAKAKGTLKRFGKDVGGATKELRLMSAVSGGMGGKLGIATTAMTTFTGVLRAATVAAGSLSVALWPVTLVMAAIALIIGPLIVYFTESQEGMDKMTVAAAEVSATFDVLLDRVMTFGEAMYDIFFAKDYVSGWEKMKKAMLGIAKEIEDESKAAGRLAEALLVITRLENKQIVRRAKAKTMIKAFNKDADDRTKTYEERALAARAAIKVEQQLAKEEIALLKERLQKEGLQIESKEEFNKIYEQVLKNGEIDLEQIGLSSTKELDRKQIYSDVAKIYTRNTESLQLQTRLNNKLNQIEEEKQREVDKTNTEIQKGIDKKTAELALTKKIKQEEAVKAKKVKKKNDDSLFSAQMESRLQMANDNVDDLLLIESERYQRQLAIMEQNGEDTRAFTQKHLNTLNDLYEQADTQSQERTNRNLTAQQSLWELDFSQKVTAAQGNTEQLITLENERHDRLLNLKFLTDAEIELAEQEHQARLAAIKQVAIDEEMDRVDAANAMISAASAEATTAIADAIGKTLAGDASAMKKGFDTILLIMFDFASAFGKSLIAFGVASKALGELIKDPILAIFAGIALVALASAGKALFSKGMNKTTEKAGSVGFASGGVVGGTSFTGDKIPISVNSGEMILNRKQQSGLFGGSSVINVQGILRGEDIYLSNLEAARIQNNTL